MKLRCIGGPAHNKYEYVRDDIKIGDWVQVREPRKYDPNTPIYLDPHKMAEMMTDVIHIYRIDVLGYTHQDKSTSKIYILLFDNMSIWQALEHQFK